MKKQKNKKHSIHKDVFVLVLAPLAAAWLSWVLRLNFLVSSILFFAVPGVYLSLIDKAKVKRILVFTAFFSLAGFYADYIAEKNLAWAGPATIFPFRILGLVPVENLVWFSLLVYLVLAYYEHYFDHTSHRAIGHKMKLLYLILIIASVAFLPTLFTPSEYLHNRLLLLKARSRTRLAAGDCFYG